MNDSDPTSSIPTIHSHNESECIDDSENDQVLYVFLSLLDDGIRSHPEKLIPLDSTLLARLDSLIGGLDFDINSPLLTNDQ